MNHIIYPELFKDNESIIRFMMNIVINENESSFILSSSFIPQNKFIRLYFLFDEYEPGRRLFYTEDLKQKILLETSGSHEKTFEILTWLGDGYLSRLKWLEEFKESWNPSGLTKFNEYRLQDLRKVIENFFINHIALTS